MHDFDPVQFPSEPSPRRLLLDCWLQRAAFWVTMAGVAGLWLLSLLGLI